MIYPRAAEPVGAPSIDVSRLWETNPLLRDVNELQPRARAHTCSAIKHYTISIISILVVAILSIAALAVVCMFAIELIPFVFLGAALLLKVNDSLFFRSHYREAKSAWAERTFENKIIKQIKDIHADLDLLNFDNRQARLEKMDANIQLLTDEKKSIDDKITETQAKVDELEDGNEENANVNREVAKLGRSLAVLRRQSEILGRNLEALTQERVEIARIAELEVDANGAYEQASMEMKAARLEALHKSIGALPLSERKIDLLVELKDDEANDELSAAAKKVVAYSAIIPIIARSLVHQEHRTAKSLQNMQHFFSPMSDEENGIIQTYRTKLAVKSSLQQKANKTPEDRKQLQELTQMLQALGRDRLAQKHAYYADRFYSVYLASIASNPFGEGKFEKVGETIPYDPATDSVTREIYGQEIPLFTLADGRTILRIESNRIHMEALHALIMAAHRGQFSPELQALFNEKERRAILDIFTDVMAKRTADSERLAELQEGRRAPRPLEPHEDMEEFLVSGLDQFVGRLVTHNTLTNQYIPFDPRSKAHYGAVAAYLDQFERVEDPQAIPPEAAGDEEFIRLLTASKNAFAAIPERERNAELFLRARDDLQEARTALVNYAMDFFYIDEQAEDQV